MADDSGMEGGGGDVVIRLSQEGGDEVIAQLQKLVRQLEDVGATAKKTGEGVGQIDKGMQALTDVIQKGAIGAMVAGFGIAGEAVLKAYEGVKKLGEAYGEFAAEMMKVRGEHEQLEIRLAALEDRTVAWSNALGSAKENLDAIEKMSTAESTEALVQIFTQLRYQVGGTSESLRELTQRMTLYGQASGVTAEQLMRVITMAERSGQYVARGGLLNAVQALRGAGIEASDIQRAYNQGNLGELLGRLQLPPEQEQALRNSLKNITNDMKTATEQAKELIGQGFEPLKGVIKDFTAALSSNEGQSVIRGIADDFKVFNQTIIGIVDAFKSFAGGTVWTILKAQIDEVLIKFITLGTYIEMVFTRKSFSQAEAQIRDRVATVLGVPATVPRGAPVSSHSGESVTPGLVSSHGAAAGTYNPLGPQVTDQQLFEAQQATREAQNQAALALDGGFLQKRVQIEDTANQELAKLRFKQAHESTKLADETAKQITAVEDRKNNQLYAMRAEEVLAVVKNENEIKTIREDAARSGLQGVAASEQQLADTRAQAQRKAFEALLASWNDDAATRLEATRKFNATMLAEDEKYANQLRIQREAEAVEIQSKGMGYDAEVLKAKGDEYEAAMLGINQKLLNDEHDFAVKYGDLMDQLQAEMAATFIFNPEAAAQLAERLGPILELLNKMRAASKANADETTRQDQVSKAGMTQNWAAYWDDQQRQIDKGKKTYLEALGEMAQAQEKWAKTAEEGWEAVGTHIRASVTSFGQSVAQLGNSMWDQLTSTFDEGFYDVLSGKLSSIGDLFKNLFDSILKDFAKMLSQMLVRWLVTGELMGKGEGTGGILGGLLGKLGGGDNAVYTPGGTGGRWGMVGAGQSAEEGGYGNPFDESVGEGGGGGGLGKYASYLGYAAAAYQIFQGIKAAGQKTTSEPTYNGTNLGQTADFGGASGQFGTWLSAAATVAVAGGFNPYAIIAAVVIAIVGAIVSIINGPEEGHIYVAVQDAFQKTGAHAAVGQYVKNVIDGTANFVGELALKAVGPEGVGKYTAMYREAFLKAYGSAAFDIHAGSPEDLQKDVNDFFNKVLPTLTMKAAFGQVGYGMGGDSGVAGGIAGVSWNTNNGLMDRDGNWVKKQLYDPEAPIPLLLKGLGFSADAISAIAEKLASGVDIKKFQQDLLDLVTVVVNLGDLAKQFGRTTQEWFDFIHKTQAEQGTAAQFKESMDALKAEGILLEAMFGDDRISKAKELVQSSQTLLSNMAQALASILQMIDQIKETSAATIQSYKDKLLTPSERETNARAAYERDFAKIAAAANPQQVQQAWQQVMKDLGAVLDALVARIQAIKSLLQSYADFEKQIAADAGPQFATDPRGWLAQNSAQITAIQTALQTATGDDAVSNARELLSLVQQRYQNELAMLHAVDAAIKSITTQTQQTIDQLTMQAMGEVKYENGKPVWKPDVHAQGEYLTGRYNDLMAQLANAQTPEAVQAIMSQINSIISQLAAQPQDPTHYAESRQKLIDMARAANDAAIKLLNSMRTSIENDLKGIGQLLKDGEKALDAQLKKDTADFTKYLGEMEKAAGAATAALQTFADQLTDSMRELSATIKHWQWVMTHGPDEKDPGWDYDANAPIKGGGQMVTPKDIWVEDPEDPDFEICVKGPHTGQRRRKPGTRPGGGHPPDVPKGPGESSTYSRPPLNVTVTVNSGSPEEIAAAAAAAVYDQTLGVVTQNNRNLVRVLRTNPSLLA